MTKALVTVAEGGHAEYLAIAQPSLEVFADRHGYTLLQVKDVETTRPASWWKIPGLIAALNTYDEALFVGADFVCVDPSEDLDVPAEAWQALVAHRTGDGEVPNADFWYLRQPMLPILTTLWGKWEYTNHGWWEQAALMDMMGYKDRPSLHVEPTELYDHTYFLDAGWNVHTWDRQPGEHPRFRHATMWPDRAAIMREWAAEALVAA